MYTWAAYTDDQLLQDFQDKTGIKVIVDIYDSNETMLAKLQAGGGDNYSIICPSDYMVTKMVNMGMLMPLDQSRLPGRTNLRATWQDPSFDRGNQHSIPNNWGTTGLTYDPKQLGFELKGWRDLWENTAPLTRKVSMVNDVREVLGSALLTLGYSMNSTDPKQIKEAYDQLVAFKPAIAAFMTSGWESQIVTGDLRVAMGYSPNAITLVEENPNLAYLIPETGSSLWSDNLAIPKTAPNPDAAYEWMNFILTPDVAKAVAERLKLGIPNQKGFEMLPDALKNDKRVFPDDAILSKCQILEPLPPETLALYDQYWTQLSSS
jgi:spermidine/putrescine transport system substrate-binding protein